MHQPLIINATTLAFYHWPVDQARAVVQISHGMAEYLQRYDTLAKFLNSHGIAVLGADHRGHGYSRSEQDPLGYFGDGATWDTVVDDLHSVRQYAQTIYPELPYFFVGHSMGSLLLRSYLHKYASGLAGAAIIGTGLWPKGIGDAGYGLALALGKILPMREAKLLSVLSFGPYNRGFGHRTPFEWLSRDSKEVDAYVADPLCGYTPPNVFFTQILGALKAVNTDAAFELPAQVPLYLASGEVDPFGGEQAVRRLTRIYKRHGQRDVEAYIYPGARHEIFNEINRAEVFSDLENWLSHHI
ncbi:alpha-beta hydrolase superfamily lysophospholipase [Arcanobacterium pluranimalium]|uniref:alpha/beta fold hydrolase n=1 Tax=Arcanobacterium pluranimalium TaxID=108028 RepID=UPI00195E5FDC|nr:alpha/beta hydrolase [Arcanobacterium pluranimalium]MBM7824756.1 alpha-beta hydrolase superfamily lysophospholipase [Arcanobacterium pluranimalium]